MRRSNGTTNHPSGFLGMCMMALVFGATVWCVPAQPPSALPGAPVASETDFTPPPAPRLTVQPGVPGGPGGPASSETSFQQQVSPPPPRPQQSPPTSNFAPGEEPVAVYEKTHVDLGTVSEGESIAFSFPFRNAGKSELVVVNIRRGCGCTRAEATKQSLQPGETAEIEGEFNTAGFPGKQVKTVHVRTNDPKNPETALRIEATVRKEIEIEPPNLYFPTLGLGEAGTQQIRITNLTETPLRITNIQSSNDARVSARIVTPRATGEDADGNASAPVVGEANPVLLEVVAHPSDTSGNFSAMLTLQTDSESRPTLQVFVNGKIAGDIEVYPANIFFGLVRDNQPSTRTATLSSRSGTPFKITKMEVFGLGRDDQPSTPTATLSSQAETPLQITEMEEDSGIMPLNVAHEPLEGREGYRIRVGIDGELKQQRNNATIVVQTDHPTQKTVEIGVTAFVRQ